MDEHLRAKVLGVLAIKQHVDRYLQTLILLWLKKKAEAERRRRIRRIIRHMILAKQANANGHIERRWWIRPRSNASWFRRDSVLWPEDKWIENFRMSRTSFYKLVTILEPLICKEDTNFRQSILPDERVAIALSRLTTHMFYRNLADLFGRGVSTCHSITNDVISAICQLRSRFIKWPRGDELRDTINGFHNISKFPMIAGAIDGCHIPVLAPADQRNDYWCYKSFYSVVLQGVADYQCRFINAFCGFPGRAHDARVFSSSSVYRHGVADSLFADLQGIFDGVAVKPLLVADSAYPLLHWVMKGYPGDSLSPAEAEFNVCLNTARNVIERAFGILKARFRCLRKQIDMDVVAVADLVIACCCLHNFCIDNKEVFLPEWMAEAEIDEQDLQRFYRQKRDEERARDFNLFDNLPVLENDNDAAVVRNSIKNYLFAKLN